MAQMRGTAIRIGNLPGARSLSATAQLAATAMRLRQAGASGDVAEIQSALLSVSAPQLPHGVPISAEVQDLAAELRQRITEDEDLARLDAVAAGAWMIAMVLEPFQCTLQRQRFGARLRG